MATTHLAILSALFIVLVAAEASIFRTTVTTIETSDSESSSSQQQQQQCRKQIQGQQLDECRSFLQSGQSVLRLVAANPQQTPPDECCEQLRNVDAECRCELINKMWREMQQSTDSHGQQKEEQQQQMKKKAQFLPAMCQMEPQVCSIEQTSEY